MNKLITALVVVFPLLIFSQKNQDEKKLTDTLIFDLKNAIYTNHNDSFFVDIPIRLKSQGNVSNFDFWFKFDESKLKYISTQSTYTNLDSYSFFNSNNHNLSNTSSGPSISFVVPNNTPLVKMRFLLQSKCIVVTSSLFNSISTLTEGSPAKYLFTGMVDKQIQNQSAANCEGAKLKFAFSDSIYNKKILSYDWLFNNTQPFTGQVVEPIINASGQATANLTVMTADSCTYVLTDLIQLIPKPTANFNFNLGNSGLVNFMNTSTQASVGIQSVSWLFGNGGLSSIYSPDYSYIVNGNYSVTLTVKDSLGCWDSIVKVISISNIVVGLTEMNTSSLFGVSPNPTSGVLSITSFTGPKFECALIDLAGQIVLTHVNEVGQVVQLALHELPRGNYILTIKTDQLAEYKLITVN